MLQGEGHPQVSQIQLPRPSTRRVSEPLQMSNEWFVRVSNAPAVYYVNRVTTSEFPSSLSDDERRIMAPMTEHQVKGIVKRVSNEVLPPDRKYRFEGCQ